MPYFSALYMLWNVLIFKFEKLYTVNLYVFLSALYTLQYVPIVTIPVIVHLFKKKKKMTRTSVWVKIPKLCHNTPLSIFFLAKGREFLCLKTLQKKKKKKTKYKCAFCPALSTKKIQVQTKRGRHTSKLPKTKYIFSRKFHTFPVTEGNKI